MHDDYVNKLNAVKKDILNTNTKHQVNKDEEISVFSSEYEIFDENYNNINNNNDKEFTVEYITAENVIKDIDITEKIDDTTNNKLKEIPSIIKKTIRDKIIIGFTVPNDINSVINNTKDLNNLKDVINQSEQEQSLIDPIGLTGTDGTKYDFIIDDGDFNNYEDFLGSSNGITDLLNLNLDGYNNITGAELANGKIKVVRTDPLTKQQEILSIEEVEAELGGKISIDVSSIDANSKENQNYKVYIEKDNGEIQTYTGYSTYENEEYFKINYNYSIDGIKELDDTLNVYFGDEYENIRDDVYKLDSALNKAFKAEYGFDIPSYYLYDSYHTSFNEREYNIIGMIDNYQSYFPFNEKRQVDSLKLFAVSQGIEIPELVKGLEDYLMMRTHLNYIDCWSSYKYDYQDGINQILDGASAYTFEESYIDGNMVTKTSFVQNGEQVTITTIYNGYNSLDIKSQTQQIGSEITQIDRNTKDGSFIVTYPDGTTKTSRELIINQLTQNGKISLKDALSNNTELIQNIDNDNFGATEYECRLTNLTEYCNGDKATANYLLDVLYSNQLVEDSAPRVLALDFGAAFEICKTSENKTYSTPLEKFAQSGFNITDSLYGTEFTEYIRTSANTNQDVYDYIKTTCGGDKDAADKIYKFIMSPMYGKERQDKMYDWTAANPYTGRQETLLMDRLYVNQGSNFVLNPQLLNEFTEYIDVTDENGEKVQLPVKQYYTNFDGDICTLEYEYHNETDGDNFPYITLSFKEDTPGAETKELSYYITQNEDKLIYCILNENGQDIEETEEEFLRRLTVLENYTSKLPDGLLSTDEVQERYTMLKGFDDRLSPTLSSIISEFASEGWIDDIRNWFVDTFDTSGISDEELKDAVKIELTYPTIIKLWDDGPEGREKAKYLLGIEACRRYLEDGPNALNCIVAYEDLAAIANGRKDIREVFCNINITKEDMYTYLTGGVYNETNVENYETASEVFTEYNTVLLTLKDCKTPEEAFILITGHSLKNATDEDIALFNSYYGPVPLPTKDKIINSGHADIFKDVTEVNIEDATEDDILKFNDYYISFGPDYEAHIPDYVSRNFVIYHLYVTVNETRDGFTYDYREKSDDGGDYIPKDMPDTDLNLFLLMNQQEYEYDFCGLKYIKNSSRLKNTNEKFYEFYEKNKDTVNEYIHNYAVYAANDEKCREHFKGKCGLTAEEIENYILNEGLYSESCNYMQFAYTTAKQILFGESELDFMTSQYCAEMASYTSTLSHIVSVGCMAASVVFPAAAPELIVGARAAGYLDNTLDLVNMLTNDQNYQDDDYLGWATSTGFEVVMKAGYRYFSNIACDLGGRFTNWLIDKTGGESSYLAQHALSQILVRGTSEALIETGICLPYTAAIKTIQGGDYSLWEELRENFIYDFLPYARGWQDILIKGSFGNTTFYGGDGKYYQIPDTNERLYVDSSGKPLALKILVGDQEITKVKYTYSDDGSYKVVQYADDGQTKLSSKKIVTDSDGTTKIYDGEDESKLLQETEKYREGHKTTYYDETGKLEQYVITNKKGFVIESGSGSTKYTYNKSGRVTSVTSTTDDGTEITINYSRSFGKTKATIQVGEGDTVEYSVDRNGMILYKAKNGLNVKFTEQNIIQAISSGIGLDKLTQYYKPNESLSEEDLDILCALGEVHNKALIDSGASDKISEPFAKDGKYSPNNRNLKLIECSSDTSPSSGLRYGVYESEDKIIIAVDGLQNGNKQDIKQMLFYLGQNTKLPGKRLVSSLGNTKQIDELDNIYKKWLKKAEIEGKTLVVSGYSLGGANVKQIAKLHPEDTTTQYTTFNAFATENINGLAANDLTNVKSYYITGDKLSNARGFFFSNLFVGPQSGGMLTLADRNSLHSLEAFLYSIE